MISKKKTRQLQAEMTLAHHDYAKGLNARAFFKTKNIGVSQDLVQDTFMKTWLYVVKGGKIEVMKAFLYHILNHLIVDEYRKHKSVSLDAILEKGHEPLIVEHVEQMSNMLDGKGALELIKQLPQKYQKIMRMRYIQDLTLEEIALLTGQSKNTIAVQAHRGLERIKKLYKHY